MVRPTFQDVLSFLVDASKLREAFSEDLIRLLIADYTFSLDDFLVSIPRLGE